MHCRPSAAIVPVTHRGPEPPGGEGTAWTLSMVGTGRKLAMAVRSSQGEQRDAQHLELTVYWCWCMITVCAQCYERGTCLHVGPCGHKTGNRFRPRIAAMRRGQDSYISDCFNKLRALRRRAQMLRPMISVIPTCLSSLSRFGCMNCQLRDKKRRCNDSQ